MSWAYLDDHFDEHPKVEKAGEDAAWLYVCGLLHCNRNLTGGFVAAERVKKLTGKKNPIALAEKLVKVGLWERDGEDYRIHDYEEHNQSAEGARRKRQAKAKKAAEARWSNAQANAPSNAQASGEHVPEQCSTDAIPQSQSQSPSPVDKQTPLTTSSERHGARAGELGNQHLADFTALSERLTSALSPNAGKGSKAAVPRVLDLALKHYDRHVVDERIGQMLTLKHPANHPAYLLTCLDEHAVEAGMPSLNLQNLWKESA